MTLEGFFFNPYWKYVYFVGLIVAFVLAQRSRDVTFKRAGYVIFLSWVVYVTFQRHAWGVYVYGALDVLLGIQLAVWYVVTQYKSVGWMSSIFGLMVIVYMAMIMSGAQAIGVPGLLLNVLFLAFLLILGGASIVSRRVIPVGQVKQPEVQVKWRMIGAMTGLLSRR